MDNSNDITGSITQQNIASPTPVVNGSSNGDGGLLNSIKSVSVTTWILIFLILAFLGFNIFVYLAKGTDSITSFFAPLVKQIMGLFAYVTSSVVEVTASGAQNILNSTTNVVDSGLTAVQNKAQQVQEKKSPTNLSSQPVQQTNKQPDPMSNNALNKSLNTATASTNSNNNNDYQADESTSTIQSGGNKSGWCYIGEDRGFRSCVEVGQQDNCLSGDIFPSKDICVNPNLRS
jgi:hypothetical protein